MITVRHVAALISAGSLLAVGAIASGQSPAATQADFDRCNRQAQAALSSNPSASPGTGSTTTPGSGAAGSGSMSSDKSSGTPASGSVTSGTGASPSSDPVLRGMASVGLSDPAYQQAYRDCIQSK